jgi:maltose alpha-D-glucosyltransferase/alpha-amylase
MLNGTQSELLPGDDPLWYRDAIIYEFHVRAFKDSNADGVGDFAGLTEKLDYLQDLGVTALWLLPFYPSPLKDDGYDIADYTSVNPAYGTLRDFKTFLREAHRRGLKVIIELVLNHTSDRHPWFQRARRAKPGDPERDFYVWSDSLERYKDARIIFKDFEFSNWTWDPQVKAYYWHRFYSHQPDLNYDNPQVRKAMFQVLDFWLGMGVDGLRLDAVPYLYEREGTTCENLKETHGFLKDLRRHVDENFKNRMLLAEANQWPEDSVAYFGAGDESHLAFHFPLMPRLFMAIRMEDRFPIIDILEQTPAIPETCQWATFLRNHDELTLEMVTDEERDYMYRVYAHDPHARINLGIRRRLAPLLENNRRRIELMNGLLFSLLGTPVLYYGDEIGMGDNIYLGDRNGVRTPLQWNSDRNAGFSQANPQRLYLPVIIDPEYNYEAINVEAQQNNTHSLLWWMKRLISLRKRFKAFGRGGLEFLTPDNRKVLAFTRRFQDERILVVANLSRYVQYVELDLSAFRGVAPLEVFGRTEFPVIGERPYFLTLGPHSFFWFSLEAKPSSQETSLAVDQKTMVPTLNVVERWEELLEGKPKLALEEAISGFLKVRRWFGGKARHISTVRIHEVFPAPGPSGEACIATVLVEYLDGDPETYLIPLAYAQGERSQQVLAELGHLALARVQVKARGQEGVLFDGLGERGFQKGLLEAMGRRRRFRGGSGELLASSSKGFQPMTGGPEVSLEPAIVKAEQSNSSVVYGDRVILKLFRKLEPGLNPELEIGRFLTERNFPNTPAMAGDLQYRHNGGEPMTLGVLSGFVPKEGDGWQYTLDALGRFFERAMVRPYHETVDEVRAPLLMLVKGDLPHIAYEMVGTYLTSAELLGQRTAELHSTLASAPDNPSFCPEPFTPLTQRALYQSWHNLTNRVFQLLRKRHLSLPEEVRPAAQRVLELKGEVLKRFRAVMDLRMSSLRIRCHGDYHLGQVLYTGKDFFIIDFEGEPARPLSERRLKRSPLRDVAGMMRSFHYAGHAAIYDQAVRPEDRASLLPWIRFWTLWVKVAFLKSYLEVAAKGAFLQQSPEELSILLSNHLLEKAVYEVGYELDNRPLWLGIPLEGILELMDEEARA